MIRETVIDVASVAHVARAVNTLRYDSRLCINCGLCSIVCPHAVFASGERLAKLVRSAACMECGACQLNCPTAAITVNSGVGCAAAMIYAALTGRKDVTCGGEAARSGCDGKSGESCCS